MKRTKKIFAVLILILFLTTPALAFEMPRPTDAFYVNDFANVIDSSTEQYILSRAVPLQQKTGAQIVVVTVDTIGDDSLTDVALRILRGWGIGDREKNNGVLILLVVNDRMSRIEVGYGLEGALPDGKTGRIQDDYMIPHFAEGNYSQGIKAGFQAILNEVYKEYGIEEEIADIPVPVRPGDEPRIEFSGLIILILLLIDWIFLRGRITRLLLMMFFSGRGGRGGFGGGSFGGGGFGGGRYRGGGGSGGGGGSSRKW